MKEELKDLTDDQKNEYIECINDFKSFLDTAEKILLVENKNNVTLIYQERFIFLLKMTASTNILFKAFMRDCETNCED